MSKRDIGYEIKCIICNQTSVGGVREKSRFSEVSSASHFLEMYKFFKDEVFQRLAEIDNVSRLIAANIYYHKLCLCQYLMKFETSTTKCLVCLKPVAKWTNTLDNTTLIQLLIKSRENRDTDSIVRFLDYYDEDTNSLRQFSYAHSVCVKNYLQTNLLTAAFYDEHVKPLITNMLLKGYGLCISEIREFIAQKRPGTPFYNQLIKAYIKNSFGPSISFCKPFRKYDSEVVFPSSISPADMVAKIQTLDSV